MPDSKPRLLIIGAGPAGVNIARNLSSEFEVVVVDPKDYFEFTPGILRGYADPTSLTSLEVELSCALGGAGEVTHIRGEVVNLEAGSARVRLSDVGALYPVEHAGQGQETTLAFDFAVLAVGSRYAGSGLWKVTGAPGEQDMTSLGQRRQSIEQVHQRLLGLRDSGGTVILVGAGLVGVELAAELAHFIPGLRVVLADLADRVLPALPARAQEYAKDWLESHGVELRLGQPLPRGSEAVALGIEGDCEVFGCAGVQMRNDFAASIGQQDSRGAIIVNMAMQVLARSDAIQSGVHPAPESHPEAVADGRIFALGDCVSVHGADPPVPREIYFAEAEAEVVATNLRRLAAGNTGYPELRELRLPLNHFCICSLGPDDAIFVGNGSVWATGWSAATMKGQIESTKMGQMRNEVWGSLIWRFVPHW